VEEMSFEPGYVEERSDRW